MTKKIKCDECNGSGTSYIDHSVPSSHPYHDDHMNAHTCGKCGGGGSIANMPKRERILIEDYWAIGFKQYKPDGSRNGWERIRPDVTEEKHAKEIAKILRKKYFDNASDIIVVHVTRYKIKRK